MTFEEAVKQLDEMRHTGDLETFRRLVDATEPQLSGEDSVRFLLHACDILSSHDLGDYESQTILTHRYAGSALDRNLLTGLERELRILAYLEHDYRKAAEGKQDWQMKRLSHSRKWLRALRIIEETNEEPAIGDLPHLKPLPPEAHLPAGVSPEHLAESPARDKYLNSIQANRQKAERFALRWRLEQLRRLYEPIAARYILSAYGREPYNLEEMRELFSELPNQTRRGVRSETNAVERESTGLLRSCDSFAPSNPSFVSTVRSTEKTATRSSPRPQKPRRRAKRKK